MRAAVSCRNVTKRYPGFTLSNLNLEIPEGTIVGFVGENGAGKSTTIKAMLNLVRPDEGEITVLGEDSRSLSREAREQIGVVFDGCHLPQELSACQVEQVFRRIYRRWDGEAFRRLAQRFSLPEGKRVKEYSRGMQMKLAIACALAHHPRLLLLDEATSGLDPMVRDEILDLFLDFLQDEHHAIFLSSHIISDIEKAADYVAFLHQGKLLFMEEKDRLREQYGLAACGEGDLERLPEGLVAGKRTSAFSTTVLVRDRQQAERILRRPVDPAPMEEILLYLSKGGEQ